jgi:hypothetical protein
MINKNLKFIVNRKPQWDAYEIYLVGSDGVRSYIYNIGKDGKIIEKVMVDGAVDSPPLMMLGGDLWESFVLAVSNNLPNIKKDVVDAELTATKYHLEDMRDIVFKKSK